MKVAFLFLPPWDPKYPSYAAALFKASTKEAGHEFIEFDLNVDLYNAADKADKKLWDGQVANLWSVDYDHIINKYAGYLDSYLEKIFKNEIDLYAVSINHYSMHLGLFMARKIKERNSEAIILFGGPQCFPSYDGIKVLENKCVDAICTGEGDVIWPKVLEHFNEYRNLQIDIPGICYKKDDDTITDNGVPELVKDLNSIPFADYSDIDFAKYGNAYHFSIMTSRGCINTCAFCSERPNYYKYRFRNAENIFNEIAKQLSDLQNNPSIPLGKKIVPYISFNDSLIDGVPKELEKFCDLVIASGLNFIWGGMALIRKELTSALLLKMKKAGCHALAWGLESGCQEVLNLMHKKYFDMKLAKEVIKLVRTAGITQSISLIAGFPGETEEMFLETKEFVEEYKDYFIVGVQPMMIAKNSLVYDKPEDFGVACVDDWLKWQTIDGTNNYEVRLKRVELLKSTIDADIRTVDKESRISNVDLTPEIDSSPEVDKVANTISWKNYVGSRLSNQTKQRIRKSLGLLGIRV